MSGYAYDNLQGKMKHEITNHSWRITAVLLHCYVKDSLADPSVWLPSNHRRAPQERPHFFSLFFPSTFLFCYLLFYLAVLKHFIVLFIFLHPIASQLRLWSKSCLILKNHKATRTFSTPALYPPSFQKLTASKDANPPISQYHNSSLPHLNVAQELRNLSLTFPNAALQNFSSTDHAVFRIQALVPDFGSGEASPNQPPPPHRHHRQGVWPPICLCSDRTSIFTLSHHVEHDRWNESWDRRGCCCGNTGGSCHSRLGSHLHAKQESSFNPTAWQAASEGHLRNGSVIFQQNSCEEIHTSGSQDLNQLSILDELGPTSLFLLLLLISRPSREFDKMTWWQFSRVPLSCHEFRAIQSGWEFSRRMEVR